MQGTICALFDCDDWQAELENALDNLGIGWSVVTNNGNGTVTHTSGNGDVVLLDFCQIIADGDCDLFAVQAEDATNETIQVGDTFVLGINPNAAATQTTLSRAGNVVTLLYPQPQNNSQYVTNVDGTITLDNGTGGVAEPDVLTIPLATPLVPGLILDRDRAWGTGDAQQQNSDDVTVADTIYHEGDTIIGDVDSNINAGAKLTVVDNVAVTNTFDHVFGGTRSLLAGQTNTATGNRVVGWGRDNSFANNSGGGGNGNNTVGTNSFTVGEDNINTSDESIVGGSRNTTTGVAQLAVGQDNTATGNTGITFGSVSANNGGDQIVGGRDVISNGERGIAVGTNIDINNVSTSSAAFGKALTIDHDGVFAWGGDLLNPATILTSVEDGEFMSRSTGTRLYVNRDGTGSITQGVLIGSANNFAGTFLETSAGGAFTAAGTGTGAGAHLTTGGVWTNASSMTMKENFENVYVLDIVRKLKITRWNYKATSDRTHIGAMAEQFHELFKTGTKGTIDTITPAFVAIRAVQEQDEEVAELKAMVKELSKQVKALTNKLNKVVK